MLGLTLLALAALAAPDDLLIRHARLWDGTGAPPRPDAWVRIADGTVVAVGDEPFAEDPGETPVLDAGGRTTIPGLIDSHTHPMAVPGADLRGDPPARRDELRKYNLRAYLACGVTTVLDTGVPWDEMARLRGWLAAGEPGPRYLPVGPVIGPSGGYVDAFLEGHPGIDTLGEAIAHLDRLVAEGAIGAKITIETGHLKEVWPLHPPELRAAIVREAKARGLLVFFHAAHEREQELALEQRPRALLHLAPGLGPEHAARIAASGAWQVTTVTLYDAPLLPFEPERRDDAWLQRLAPPDLLDTALSRAGWRAYKLEMARITLPGVPDPLRRLGRRFYPGPRWFEGVRTDDLAAVRRLRAAGAKLVVGSDSGAYEVIPYFLHGISTLREIELLTQADLTPEEALLAATREPATMLEMAGEIGVIAPGSAGDLVIYDGDPLKDPAALRSVRWTVRAGEARTPAEWLGPLP